MLDFDDEGVPSRAKSQLHYTNIRRGAPPRDPPLAHEIIDYLRQCRWPDAECCSGLRHVCLRMTAYMQQHPSLERCHADRLQTSPEPTVQSQHSLQGVLTLVAVLHCSPVVADNMIP